MLRYAYNTLVYGDEPVADSYRRIAGFGYDAVELIGEPDHYDVDEVCRLRHEHGIPVSSIVSIYTPERDLVSSDAQVRAAALDYVRGNVDFAAAVGADIVTLTPTACMKIIREAALEQEWDWAVEGARAATRYANDRGVTLAVEPWNRYETYLVNRLEQSAELVDRVGEPGIGAMADTFHMSIEEVSIADALRAAGSRLVHVHLADSNRAAPGAGHLDFAPIVAALQQIDYRGWCSFELLPAAGDVFGVLQGGEAKEFFDPYTEQAITHLQSVETALGLRP